MSKKIPTLVIISILFLSTVVVRANAVTSDDDLITSKITHTTYLPGKIIIKKKTNNFSFQSRLTSFNRHFILKEYPLIKTKLTKDTVGLERIFIVNTVPGEEKRLIKILEKDSEIEYAELDYLAKNIEITPIIPNDLYYTQ